VLVERIQVIFAGKEVNLTLYWLYDSQENKTIGKL
jgi:hypothetical protein